MTEEWRTIPEFPNYEASSQGRVRSLPRRVAGPHAGALWSVKGGILSQTMQGDYLAVCIAGAPRSVHRLVASAFCKGRESGLWVLHNDGDQLNNRSSNLRWGTPSDNARDTVRHGKHGNARKTHCKWGHPLLGENLYVSPKGSRECRHCRRDALERLYARRAVAPKPDKK